MCSCFGLEHIKYDCIKIFFTVENITPDFNQYDYAIGFDDLNFGDRYIRYPIWLIPHYRESLENAKNKHLQITEKLYDRDFCSFVVSNSVRADPIREIFFDKIQRIGHIASGGIFKNNIGGRVENKIEFLKKFRFNIAFENSSYLGYCTEKIIEAFSACTIPIYWGDPSLMDERNNINFINPKSYINIGYYPSLDQAIDFVDEVNHNKELYLSFLREKAFLIDDVVDFYDKRLEDFFDNIFETPLNQARKINDYFWRKHCNRQLKKIYLLEKIALPIRRIKTFINPKQ